MWPREVFSSPCITPDKQSIVCGSHGGCVYCLNCADGSLMWLYQRVYSSPCVFEGSPWGNEGTLVGLASTDGTLCVLDGENGTLRASLCPGSSSPVVCQRSWWSNDAMTLCTVWSRQMSSNSFLRWHVWHHVFLYYVIIFKSNIGNKCKLLILIWRRNMTWGFEFRHQYLIYNS